MSDASRRRRRWWILAALLAAAGVARVALGLRTPPAPYIGDRRSGADSFPPVGARAAERDPAPCGVVGQGSEQADSAAASNGSGPGAAAAPRTAARRGLVAVPDPVPADRAPTVPQVDTRPTGNEPAVADPTDTEPTGPPGADAVGAQPVEIRPADPEPAVADPAGANGADTDRADTDRADTKPVDIKPAPGPKPADPEPAAPPAPYGPGSAAPLPDGSAPSPEFTIKGNAGSMLFHTPDSPYFGRTKPEAWFRTPEAATRAGFTEWKPKQRKR